ncbi:hypothetical protein K788_0001903 (plasmid) [Paraburkholderia caribensis MBA4]|uniref:Uncharacterized protein n=1 Tax=Paraburkholderia caribensis MBA4 TaxID=1323664 RepID=A0A0P0RR34_9BURK|nr:hypothetical protein K788_0001903 [Paraburkholderia caribensis MBA4]
MERSERLPDDNAHSDNACGDQHTTDWTIEFHAKMGRHSGRSTVCHTE